MGKQIGTPQGRTVERREVTIPYYVEEGTILHGFHQAVIDIDDPKSKIEGHVSCGAGLGTDVLMMSWTTAKGKKHNVCLYMRDLLKAWVTQIDPEGAKPLPTVQVELDTEGSDAR